MKKIKLLVCMMLFSSIIVGCSSDDNNTTIVCTGIIGGIDVIMLFEANGDKLVKQVEEFDIPIADLRLEEDLDTFMSLVLTHIYGGENAKGVKGDYEVNEGVVTFTFSVDFKKANLDKLVEVGFVEKDVITAEYISLDKIVKEYEKHGFSCK